MIFAGSLKSSISLTRVSSVGGGLRILAIGFAVSLGASSWGMTRSPKVELRSVMGGPAGALIEAPS